MTPLGASDGRVVLLGLGHTNVEVVRRWRERPIGSAQLTCVSNHAFSTYSGMLSGVLAGQYPASRMQIDLARLCASAGARLIVGRVSALDHGAPALRLDDGTSIPFDVLSIGIGSVPAFADVVVDDDASLVLVKPMQTFLPRLEERVIRARARHPGRVLRTIVVGGGAGGVEVALTLSNAVTRLLGSGTALDQAIVSGAAGLLTGSRESTRRRVRRALERRDVRILEGARVVRVGARQVLLDDQTSLDVDVVVWVTDAVAPPLLATLGLPLDARGFLRTTPALQTTTGAPIFAVGDAGTIAGDPIPKAGVYAVRQGPVLWDNLGRALRGMPLRTFQPQRSFLKLLNTGDGRAIGEWRGFSFEGRWCWWLKDAIDSRFMARYQDPGSVAGGR